MWDFSIVVAYNVIDRGIGFQGTLPWNVPGLNDKYKPAMLVDLKHFKELTWGGTVIMGRKTWESLPSSYKPLPGRDNIVISRSEQWCKDEKLKYPGDNASFVQSFEKALAKFTNLPTYVIGGSSIYEHAINHPQCTTIYATELTGMLELQ